MLASKSVAAKHASGVFQLRKKSVTSLNHFFMSFIDVFLYRHIAGMQIDGLGYKKVRIAPLISKKIGSFKACLHSISVEYDGNASPEVSSPFGFTIDLLTVTPSILPELIYLK